MSADVSIEGTLDVNPWPGGIELAVGVPGQEVIHLRLECDAAVTLADEIRAQCGRERAADELGRLGQQIEQEQDKETG